MGSQGQTAAERAIDSAMALRDSGYPQLAVEPLCRAVKVEPRNARLWQTLGVVYRALDQTSEAIEAFSSAAAIAPHDVKAAHGVAQASLEAGRPAASLFGRALSLAPGDGALMLGRAAARMAEGDVATAIEELDAIVATNPLWLEGQSVLASLRSQQGDATGFAQGYIRALSAMPDALPLWIGLIDLFMRMGLYREADAVIARARTLPTAAARLDAVEASCASELGDVARADRLFAAMAGSQDPAIVERHARHLLRTARPEHALLRIGPLLQGAGGDALWPYASLAWRMTGDRRAAWLDDGAFVGVYDLDMRDLLPRLAAYLRGVHRAKAPPPGQSVRGGTQTDGPLFALEAAEIRELRAIIVAAVDRHIATMGPSDLHHPTRRHTGKPYRFAGSWSIRLTDAGHHSNHIHSQGWLSSALYVAVPSQAEMGPPPSGWLQLGQPAAELGLKLPAYQMIEPKPGRLVLFPSTMWHGTMPIAGGERLTVAFDVAAVG